MAKDTYKIIFLEDSSIGKCGEMRTGLSFDEQAEFMMEHLAEKKAGIYKIESEAKVVKVVVTGIPKKTDKEAYEEGLKDFYDGLTPQQMLSITENKKKISHNQKFGFFLSLVSANQGNNDEIHISVQGIRDLEKRNVYQSMKNILLGGGVVSARFYYSNDMFTEKDLREMIDELFKGKC